MEKGGVITTMRKIQINSPQPAEPGRAFRLTNPNPSPPLYCLHLYQSQRYFLTSWFKVGGAHLSRELANRWHQMLYTLPFCFHALFPHIFLSHYSYIPHTFFEPSLASSHYHVTYGCCLHETRAPNCSVLFNPQNFHPS